MSHRVNISLDEGEYIALSNQAAAAGVFPGTYARMIVLKNLPPIEPEVSKGVLHRSLFTREKRRKNGTFKR